MRMSRARVTVFGAAALGWLVSCHRDPDTPPPPNRPSPLGTSTAALQVQTSAEQTEAVPSSCNGPVPDARDGAWDVQSVPLRNGGSWVIAATGGEGPPKVALAATTPTPTARQTLGSLLVQRDERAAFTRLAAPVTLYTRLAAGQTRDERVQIVAAGSDGLEWLSVDASNLHVDSPVRLPALEPGAFGCRNPVPTSVAMADPGCGAGLLVAASYYDRNDPFCGGVRLFRLAGGSADPVRTLSNGGGISKVRFFDLDANGRLDLVTSRRMIDHDTGAWGDVWSTPSDGCLADVEPSTRALTASYLVNPDGCLFAATDFDVALLRPTSGETYSPFFAAGFSAHELPDVPTCWDATTHGGYAMVADVRGEFVTTPRRLDGYEGTTGPQLMAQALSFQSQPEPGSVRVATGYYRGRGTEGSGDCPAKDPCAGPALLETFPLAPASEGAHGEFAAPPCPTWQGFAQRLDVSGVRDERWASAYHISCSAGADGVALPGVNIARVVSVVSGDEADLLVLDHGSEAARATARAFSFWRAASWVALDEQVDECVRVDYLVAQSPSVWAANVLNQEPQRLTR